ncbi:uncharacterized protein LOC100375200 [Saccoglossus kowalevskii]|uniref:Trichohyalin-like isoform X1 n=1 Tax=Saccoglossus kowalevskii TaxID=10224 RepID=A0ABM0GIQ6_SACKO|nr:PREDICTED: trichohyalin-like isoform X1 [Saccoglossus kowalevskii]XP_006811528.1 PREDICTED: trichohyalin-like isoform X2 [Saccoglossus kowalevskii]
MAQLQSRSEIPPSFKSYNMYYDNHESPPSRIPQLKNNYGSGHRAGKPPPSKLEMLQSDYQKKLLREKEAKMIELYQRNQENAIRKVSGNNKNRGIVRDFFQERRAMQKQSSSEDLPTMAAHFKQKKLARDRLLHVDKPRRPSAGVTRVKPLAPIERQKGYAVPVRNGYNHRQHNGLEYNSDESDKLPTPPISRKPRLVRHHRVKQSPDATFYDDATPYSDEDAPPSKNNLKHLHEKKKKEQQWNGKREKLSDFQRWQMNQDAERQKRLDKLKRKPQPPLSDDEEDENLNENFLAPVTPSNPKSPSHTLLLNKKIKEKEMELQRMIDEQQKELNQLKQNEEREEEERKRMQEQRLREERRRREIKEQVRLETERLEREDSYNNDFHDDYSIQESYRESEPEPEPTPEPKYFPKSKESKPKSVHRHPPPPQPEPEERNDYFGNSADENNIYANTIDEETSVSLDLRRCNTCGRKFASDRLDKHAKVCLMKSSKKRKVFDPVKLRTEGTPMAHYIRQGKHLKPTPKAKGRGGNWRAKHEEFVRSIRDARKMQAHIASGGKVSDLPPPAPSSNPDYEQCPYCQRRFNPDVAVRHIPKCKDIKNRPKPPAKRR